MMGLTLKQKHFIGEGILKTHDSLDTAAPLLLENLWRWKEIR